MRFCRHLSQVFGSIRSLVIKETWIFQYTYNGVLQVMAFTSNGVVTEYYYSLTYINTRVHTSPTLLPRVLGSLYRVLGLTNPTLGALKRE